MADCCLVPQVFNAILYKCDIKPYPTLMRIHEACMSSTRSSRRSSPSNPTQPRAQGPHLRVRLHRWDFT